MKLTKIKKIILVLFILVAVFFVGTELCIMKYLKEYGYGIKELPQTTMVYFNLSKGFTVERTDDNHSVFIGRSNYIYDKVFDRKGYYESDRMGLDGFYSKKGEGREDNYHDFSIVSSNDWCHWFRVYEISGHTIEEF